MLVFSAARLLTPSDHIEQPLLLVEAGRVLDICSRSAHSVPPAVSVCDFGDAFIAPGFIDLHIHGSAGYDVMDETADALPAIEKMLAHHGVSSYLPTTVTAPLDATLRALERLADAIESRGEQREKVGGPRCEEPMNVDRSRAQPLGIHIEGPFISHARSGVHPLQDLLPPSLGLFEQLWQAARGHIRMITIATELEQAPEVIAEAARRGVCVSLGHSDADFATTERAIASGARHATHTFNAMRPLDHRNPGILGAVLTDHRLTADIIADGVHLHPSIVKLFAKAKGPEQTVLITDAISATGMPNGRYHLGAFEVDVLDGTCSLNGRLAGSVLSMDRAVRNLADFAGWSLAQALSAASRNPARVAGFVDRGVLVPGAYADFVVLNSQGEVLRTFIGGIECSA